MAKGDDIAKIKEQEQRLVFDRFDEAVAFSIGTRIRERALRDGLSLVCDVRTWDRPLFYAALPGTTGDNQHWVRRKANTVQRLMRASYRVVLEKSFEGDVFPANRGLDPADYVLAGGGFPIMVKGAGMIGCITVSGLPQREDHNVVVQAICEALGIDAASVALAAE